MNVLVGCECSQVVCSAFRDIGCNAFSCDIQEEYGGHPEWHIKGDVLRLLPGCIDFITSDGKMHKIDKPWDLIIIHPPCTYISKAGANRMFIRNSNGDLILNEERYLKMKRAVDFFYKIIDLVPGCTKLCIENPIPLKIANLPTPTQHIQPYFFGDKYVKYTYYWLYNGLMPLMCFSQSRPAGCVPLVNADSRYPGSFNSAKLRSQTTPGVARAMALQWGVYYE